MTVTQTGDRERRTEPTLAYLCVCCECVRQVPSPDDMPRTHTAAAAEMEADAHTTMAAGMTNVSPHSAAAAMTDVEATQTPAQSSANAEGSGASSSHLLYRDSVQSIVTFLDREDGHSAKSVSQLWRAAVTSARQAGVVFVARRIRAGLFGQDEAERASAAEELRMLLSSSRPKRDKDALLAALVEPTVLGQLVGFLSHGNAALAYNAAWALTNVAAGKADWTRMVVAQGAIPPLLRLLSSPDANLQEQSVWALGNIGGDSVELRDAVLAAGVLPPLLLLNLDTPVSVLRTAAFLIANLCRGTPQPDWAVVSPVLPLIARLLEAEDDETLLDATR